MRFYLSYRIFGKLMNAKEEKNERLFILPALLFVASLSFFNSYVLTFSNAMIIFGIIYWSFCLSILKKQNIFIVFVIIGSVILFSVILEFLIIISLSALFNNLIIGNLVSASYSSDRVAYCWIVIAIWFLLYYKTKNVLKGRINYVEHYLKHFYIVLFVEVIAMLYFQRVFFEEITMQIYQLWSCFLVFGMMIIMGLIFYIFYKDEKDKNSMKNIYNTVSRQRYTEMTELYMKNATIYHDMKNHLNIICKYLEGNDDKSALKYIRSIREPLLQYENNITTGNDIVDMVINHKIAEANKISIKIDIDTEMLGKMNIEDIDLCSVLSNVIDNAIEATSVLDQSKRIVSIQIKKRNDMLIIKVRNSYCVKIQKEKEMFITTKSNKQLHGLGTWSIKRIIDKYDGYINYDIKEKIFEAVITINC